jgi:hypothetical protein
VLGPITSTPSPSAPMAEPASTRRLQTQGGMIGSDARRSTTTARAAATALTANTATPGGDTQAQATPPCSRPNTSEPAATRISSAPRTST